MSIYDSCEPRVTVADVKGCCRGLRSNIDDAVVQAAIDESLFMFDHATDFKYRGICETTVRPCPRAETCPPSSWTIERAIAVFGHPEAWPIAMCGCTGAARCSCRASVLALPYVPVRGVSNITIEGVALDPTAYRMVERTNGVMRLDGQDWPRFQDLTKPPAATGAWSVTFSHGWEMPPGAARRVASAACEIAKACNGDDCVLPERFRVTKTDAGEYVFHNDYREQGLTGFEVLDDWIMVQRGGTGRARTRPSMSRPRNKPGTYREGRWLEM